MINVLYLLECLKTKELSELVANIDAPLLDINLALWDAEDAGEIEVDREKNKVKALKKATPSCNQKLADKIFAAVKYYTRQEKNITVGKLTSWVKNPGVDHNHLYHDYIISLQYLIDKGEVIEKVVSVPKTGSRPYHKFVFLCLPENPNDEWNAKEINGWMDNFKKNK